MAKIHQISELSGRVGRIKEFEKFGFGLTPICEYRIKSAPHNAAVNAGSFSQFAPV